MEPGFYILRIKSYLFLRQIPEIHIRITYLSVMRFIDYKVISLKHVICWLA